MDRWHRLSIVVMMAIAVTVMVDRLFSFLAGICIVAAGVLLEFVLFEI